MKFILGLSLVVASLSFSSAQAAPVLYNFSAEGSTAGPSSCGDDLSRAGSASISKEAIDRAMDDASGRALGACQRHENIVEGSCKVTKVYVLRVDMQGLSGGFQCYNSRPVLVTQAIAQGLVNK